MIALFAADTEWGELLQNLTGDTAAIKMHATQINGARRNPQASTQKRPAHFRYHASPQPSKGRVGPLLNRSIRTPRSDLVGGSHTEEYPEQSKQAQTFFQDEQVTDKRVLHFLHFLIELSRASLATRKFP
jgi:hypothetical protein